MDSVISQIEKLRSQLKEDIEKYEKNLGKYMGQQIADTLANEAHSAILEFYTSYHPKPGGYVRHYNFWSSYKRIHYYNGRDKRIAGVQLLADEHPDDYTGKSSSPRTVFYRVYSGYHGLASFQRIGVPTMSPSPIKRIYKKRDEIIENQEKYKTIAAQKARKDNYNLLFK